MSSFYNFPGFGAETSSFHPLVRLLDDFDAYSQQGQGNIGNTNRQRHTMKSFSPKFDVQEIGNRYELHGEFPGVEQKDIEIEFVDDHTIQIKGRTERTYQSGNPPTGFIEGPASTAAITEAGEKNGHHKGHTATVEDEEGAVKEASSTEVAKNDTDKAKVSAPQHEHKYWVSERIVGDFSRSFSFPVRVDQDKVTATMDKGVLSITIPKAQKKESKKITIN